MTDGYSKLKEDAEFRKEWVARIGLGFEIPVSNPVNDTNDTKTVALCEAV